MTGGAENQPDRVARVIKLGGSLLDCEGLAGRFRRWLGLQAATPNVVVVGGGDMADVVRQAFARHALDEESAHWLCIRVLGVTAELFARLLPEAALVRRFDDLADFDGAAPVVFECEEFLRNEDARSLAPLPHSWDVTSDSIAARLAERLSACELALLKSSLPEKSSTLAQAARTGYVDRHFPTAARRLPRVRCVNLRDDRFSEVVWSPVGVQ